jgi:hypothetical protein
MKDEQSKVGRIKPIIDDFSREELLEMAFDGYLGSVSLIMLTQQLIKAVGKEKAAKMIKESRYAPVYAEARALAESMGNPQDLDTLLETFRLKSPPWVTLVEFVYRTPNKAIIRSSHHCWEASAIQKTADKELQLFIAENWCVHDQAWVEGFNPKVKFDQPKHFLRGDDHCEFVLTLDK